MVESDFLVIGSGISGLTFALKAARHGRVAIVTKKSACDSSTARAQGGIACVTSSDDDPLRHIQDTLKAGANVCNREAVEIMVKEAPFCINELLELGVNFSKENGHYDLGREGGHSKNRILHYQDKTGLEIERALLCAVKHSPNISVYENTVALDLILEESGSEKTCLGAYVCNGNNGHVGIHLAPNTVLCTGGIGQVYLHTTNPSVATGDGIAMAYRAGVEITDMEFVQFHPTTLYTEDGDNALLTEALRGAGALLVNCHGENFMSQYHEMDSLAPRDIVARGIWSEMARTSYPCVYLDATSCGEENLRQNFVSAVETCANVGLDITRDKIPVVPAAHYICGGVKTDLDGQTNIAGLYAFGEVACTGVHGANRLASNSLLEGLVFAHRAYRRITKGATYPKKKIALNPDYFIPKPVADRIYVAELRTRVRKIMWEYAGISRSTQGLNRGLADLSQVLKESARLYNSTERTSETTELYNIGIVGHLIMSHAARRTQSCGLHFLETVQTGCVES
jgi:L-aspartate oxidase